MWKVEINWKSVSSARSCGAMYPHSFILLKLIGMKSFCITGDMVEKSKNSEGFKAIFQKNWTLSLQQSLCSKEQS